MTTLRRSERTPSGGPGLSWVGARAPFDTRAPDPSDCLVVRPKPWLLRIWEPLPTKAPSPALAQPYCCYLQTVIFYHRPYIVSPWPSRYRDAQGKLRLSGGSFVEWDKIESRLRHDDVVGFEDEAFVVYGGQVIWSGKRWWMHHGARRQDPRDRAAPHPDEARTPLNPARTPMA